MLEEVEVTVDVSSLTGPMMLFVMMATTMLIVIMMEVLAALVLIHHLDGMITVLFVNVLKMLAIQQPLPQQPRPRPQQPQLPLLKRTPTARIGGVWFARLKKNWVGVALKPMSGWVNGIK